MLDWCRRNFKTLNLFIRFLVFFISIILINVVVIENIFSVVLGTLVNTFIFTFILFPL